MDIDVNNFVNFLNRNMVKNGKKRSHDELTSDDVIVDIKFAALDRLKESNKSFVSYKGRDLTKHLTSLNEVFSQFILGLKNDKEVQNQIPEIFRLLLIAEFSVSINHLEEMSKYAKVNKNVTLNDCFDFLLKKLKSENNGYKNKTKKQKLDYDTSAFMDTLENVTDSDVNKTSESDETDETYEDDSECETSDDDTNDMDDSNDNDGDSNSSESDNDDDVIIQEPIKLRPTYANRREANEFVQQIFKSREDDNEDEIIQHYLKLSEKERNESLKHIKEINSYQAGTKPILFQIMDMPLPIGQKNHILKNYISLASSRHPENKLKTWFNALMTIPFGKYKGINLTSIKPNKVKKFLDNLQTVMNEAVYGHDEAKRQIIQMMGQQIRNPNSKGNMLGIWGPPGNGKTSLIKEGIAKAMDKPFVFISLGGATDSSFLDGHSYTYEGSIYGRIANGLINSKCMDPIIYFDELDKISKTHKGEEITNLLVHLTDPVQNSHFRDKYFHGIDIDLSRATMIFSFNDPSNVNPILLDRITTVETKYLMVSQKIHIATNYLLPEMMKEMKLNRNDVQIDDKTIKYIIDSYTHEGGVRKLKSILYSIVRELNLENLIHGNVCSQQVQWPFKVEIEHIKSLLKHKMVIEHDKIHPDDKPGVVNGLWANSLGNGGILSIETMLVPASSTLAIKATGHLEKVIKESTEVACSLAWSYLPEDVKVKFLADSKDKPMGIHIHCPDGATPKDGPSAGAALTLALYSLLTNKKIKHDIAMTGEINLEGKVTAIGGLEEKLEGAKRAGVKLVLFPKENVKHLDKIKERNKTLLDDNFKVIPIETFEEVMMYSLV